MVVQKYYKPSERKTMLAFKNEPAPGCGYYKLYILDGENQWQFVLYSHCSLNLVR